MRKVVNAALGRLTPKMNNICIVTVCEDPRIWEIVGKQIARPIARAILVIPRSLAVTRQAVYEHNAEEIMSAHMTSTSQSSAHLLNRIAGSTVRLDDFSKPKTLPTHNFVLVSSKRALFQA